MASMPATPPPATSTRIGAGFGFMVIPVGSAMTLDRAGRRAIGSRHPSRVRGNPQLS